MNLQDFSQTIAKLPAKFDTHDFIRMYQLTYPNQFAAMTNNATRLKAITGVMGSLLARWANDLGIVKQPNTVMSPNIMNKKSECGAWEKINKQVKTNNNND